MFEIRTDLAVEEKEGFQGNGRVFDTPISGKPYLAYFFVSNLFLCIAYYRTLCYNLFIHYI